MNDSILASLRRFIGILSECCGCCCCDDYGDTRNADDDEEADVRDPMTRVKLGYRGKDMWIETHGINFHQTFGKYSVLMDDNDQIIPFNRNGELIEPLDPDKKYRIVANRFGSSEDKWKDYKKKELEKSKKAKKTRENRLSTLSSNASSFPTSSSIDDLNLDYNPKDNRNT
ncbi:hypothetical protein CYY_008784 [Polysphondylium violaceum]|uniref:Uncharacterized protein n=1 Tax=Polysphondylium violaceum TaxID=133409 RepID=A0A8J4UX07_9MYCE|nr:hypothetical protein CYY_008784 [Polysphondylium violaceum]